MAMNATSKASAGASTTPEIQSEAPPARDLPRSQVAPSPTGNSESPIMGLLQNRKKPEFGKMIEGSGVKEETPAPAAPRSAASSTLMAADETEKPKEEKKSHLRYS